MKIAITRPDLLATLGRVQPVVDRNHTSPILHNLLLDAEQSTLTITGSDLEHEVSAQCSASVQQTGRTTVIAHELYDWVRKLSDGAEPIKIESEGSFLLVRSGRARLRLPCHDAERFPCFAAAEALEAFSLPAHQFLALFDQTMFAASNDDYRHYLTGVFMHAIAQPDDDQQEQLSLRAVATDGHRLARMELPFDSDKTFAEDSALRRGVIVPRKAIARLRVLLKELEPDQEVSLTIASHIVLFRLQSEPKKCVLTTKLVDGEFPKYEKVIPAENNNVLTVEKRAFVGAIERASVSSDKHNLVRLKCAPDILTITATGNDGRNANEELNCIYSGEPLEIGFNHKFLIEIAQLTKEQLQINLKDPFSAVVIRSVPEVALFVLMPLRL